MNVQTPLYNKLQAQVLLLPQLKQTLSLLQSLFHEPHASARQVMDVRILQREDTSVQNQKLQPAQKYMLQNVAVYRFRKTEAQK